VRRRLALLMLFMLIAAPLSAAEVADRFGLAATFGRAYDPHNIDFVLVTGVALFDYERVWRHAAPEPLRFKVEGSVGSVTSPRTKALASAGILALYYLDFLDVQGFRSYAEAGIGLIYGDYRVRGQGTSLNFNPQAGIGTEIRTGSGPPWFAAFRLHHVSNGGLHRDNRGINSVVLQMGKYF
jgi:lipid A 3-O-deacylase